LATLALTVTQSLLQVTEDWGEYEDGLTGRKFYFNPTSREKSWKPPRKSKGSGEGEKNYAIK
jgi:hypothetical protein